MPAFVAYRWTAESLAADVVERLSRQRECSAAFAELLESDDVIARCVAFDQYDYACTQGRFGHENPFEAYRARMLERARAELAAPPIASVFGGRSIEAANHASALQVLARAGDATDLRRVVAVLERESGEDVLAAACLAASDLLYSTQVPCFELVANLRRLALDVRSSDFLQEQAVCALGHDANANEAALIEIAAHGRYPAAGHAARLLAHADAERHRALVERLCLCWPENYPAIEVRRLLNR